MEGPDRQTFATDVREARRMSAWWCAWAAAHGVASQTSDHGEVCLNEAFANILFHGSEQHRATSIEITAEAGADAVHVTIADDGEPFDPSTHRAFEPAQSLGDAKVGGLGIHLMRSYTDDISYRRVDGRNLVTLSFPYTPHRAQ